MIGKIVSIKNSIIYVQLTINIYQSDNLVSKNVTFGNRYIGEIISVSNSMLEISLIGEIVNGKFIPGGISMPPFNSECRLTTLEEIDIIYGINKDSNVIKIGKSFIYNNYDIMKSNPTLNQEISLIMFLFREVQLKQWIE